jgi:hypothetical protein
LEHAGLSTIYNGFARFPRGRAADQLDHRPGRLPDELVQWPAGHVDGITEADFA